MIKNEIYANLARTTVCKLISIPDEHILGENDMIKTESIHRKKGKIVSSLDFI